MAEALTLNINSAKLKIILTIGLVMFGRILNFFILIGFAVFISLTFVQSLSIPVVAQIRDPEACKDANVNITNLFILTNNVPIVPAACSEGANGPIPLSPAVLGYILIRAYAFIASLAFNLIGPSLLVVGMVWTYSGLDGKSADTAKRLAKNLATALALVMFAYLVPFTIRAWLFPGLDTNLSSFFSFNSVKINQ